MYIYIYVYVYGTWKRGMPCRPEAVHFLALTGRPRLLPWMNSSTGGGGRRGKKQRTGANKGWGRRGGGGGGGDGRSDSRSGACSAGGGVARHGVRAGDERRGKSGCIGGVCHTATLALATLVPVGHLCPCSRAPHGCRQRGHPAVRPSSLPAPLRPLPPPSPSRTADDVTRPSSANAEPPPPPSTRPSIHPSAPSRTLPRNPLQPCRRRLVRRRPPTFLSLAPFAFLPTPRNLSPAAAAVAATVVGLVGYVVNRPFISQGRSRILLSFFFNLPCALQILSPRSDSFYRLDAN